MESSQTLTPASGPAEAGTRARLARLIGEEGPITVAALAGRLGVTAAGVRRHLDCMLADGLVDAREVGLGTRRGRGRPAKGYVLTDAGHSSLSNSYDDLAVQALEFLAAEHGREAVEAFAARHFADLESRLAPRVDAAGNDPAERATALATALHEEGFAASSRPVGQGTPAQAVQLCQGHCPVQHAAQRFPELCDAETRTFSRLLGVDVRRLATLAHGAHVCTTHIATGHARQPSTQTEDRTTSATGRTA